MARLKLNPDIIKKTCETCNTEFDVQFYKRNIQRFCSRKCSVNNVTVKDKNRTNVKKAFDEKYGTHPMKTPLGIQNLKSSILNKYGVDWVSKIDGWFDTVKKNNLIKYGTEIYTNNPQAKLTRLARGDKFNDDVYTRFKTTRQKNHYDKLVKFFTEKSLELLCDFKDYKGYHFSNIYKFKCCNCAKIFESSVYNLTGIFCNVCHPEKIDTFEENFYKFLISLIPNDVVVSRRNRTILLGKELDFYIAEKKLAFELNGLYWHSENGKGLTKHYHLNKTKACACHGVRLIHIFENEWNYKKNIVMSIIKNLIGCNTSNRRIFARNCEIREITASVKNEFLNRTHIQGKDTSTIKLGLFYENELVSVMTFSNNSRFDKSSDWELMRFSNSLNTNVIGGASKLFKHFIKNYKYKQIVSYSDRRYFTGKIYTTLGFKFAAYTTSNYYYIIDKYKDLQHRMSFQKHKLSKILKDYRPELSEWENMKNNGYDRIWDCGNSKFIFTNPAN